MRINEINHAGRHGGATFLQLLFNFHQLSAAFLTNLDHRTFILVFPLVIFSCTVGIFKSSYCLSSS